MYAYLENEEERENKHYRAVSGLYDGSIEPIHESLREHFYKADDTVKIGDSYCVEDEKFISE